jgi:hypothetical protein
MGLPLRSIVLVPLALLSLGQLLAGCGSLDEDTPDHLDFALPSMGWTVSPADPQWRASPKPGSIPTFVCAGPQSLLTDCCASPWDCQRYPLACDPTTNFCALTFDVQVGATVNLAGAIKENSEVQGRVFSRVALLSLTATVEIDDDLPIGAAGLFIGPDGLVLPSDPEATFFAPIALVPEAQAVVPSPAAQDMFSSLARDIQRPFTLLLSAHVVFRDDGEAEGRMLASLDGQLRAFY